MGTVIPPSKDKPLIPVIPIGLIATRAPCLLIGGGMVAFGKAKWLLECGATIEAVSLQYVSNFNALDPSRITLRQEPYRIGSDLRPYLLVIAGTNDNAVNQAVADDAARAGIPCNVVDDPPKCTFIVPATVVRGAMRLTIATGGGSPVLARTLRDELAEQFPAWYGDFVDILGVIRVRLKAAGMSYDDRARLLARLMSPTERASYAPLSRDEMEKKLFDLAGLM